jgi:hypothetical protein
MEENEFLVTAPIPKEGIIVDIRNPKGESVLIVSPEEFQIQHKVTTHPVYRNFCCLSGDKIIAASGYPHDSIHPVMGVDFSIPPQRCEGGESKWK